MKCHPARRHQSTSHGVRHSASRSLALKRVFVSKSCCAQAVKITRAALEMQWKQSKAHWQPDSEQGTYQAKAFWMRAAAMCRLRGARPTTTHNLYHRRVRSSGVIGPFNFLRPSFARSARRTASGSSATVSPAATGLVASCCAQQRKCDRLRLEELQVENFALKLLSSHFKVPMA